MHDCFCFGSFWHHQAGPVYRVLFTEQWQVTKRGDDPDPDPGLRGKTPVI